MATTAVTPVVLARNTASADLDDASGTTITTPADGWVITPPAGGVIERLILKFVGPAAGDTATIVAGDKPPAELAGLGNLAITLAANDVKYVVIEGGRFQQNDGTILVTCAAAGTKCQAFSIPAGGGGGY